MIYIVNIDDWEDEVALGEVELCQSNGVLTAQFIFAGIGGYLSGGIAHDLTIFSSLDGVNGPSSTPVTIQCD